MNKKMLSLIILVPIMTIILTGCGQDMDTSLSEIPRNIYQKNEYKTELVHKGDIVPTLNLSLIPMEMEKIEYAVSEASLEVDEIR